MTQEKKLKGKARQKMRRGKTHPKHNSHPRTRSQPELDAMLSLMRNWQTFAWRRAGSPTDPAEVRKYLNPRQLEQLEAA